MSSIIETTRFEKKTAPPRRVPQAVTSRSPTAAPAVSGPPSSVADEVSGGTNPRFAGRTEKLPGHLVLVSVDEPTHYIDPDGMQRAPVQGWRWYCEAEVDDKVTRDSHDARGDRGAWRSLGWSPFCSGYSHEHFRMTVEMGLPFHGPMNNSPMAIEALYEQFVAGADLDALRAEGRARVAANLERGREAA